MQTMCETAEAGTHSYCNQEALDLLKKMETGQGNITESTNPLWKGLEKFKDLDN
jgi:hypothetical protein